MIWQRSQTSDEDEVLYGSEKEYEKDTKVDVVELVKKIISCRRWL